MLTAYEKVKLNRSTDRPTSQKYIENIFDSFIELRGDRLFADDQAIIGGIAEINGMPVTVIYIEKGSDTDSRLKHNFGMANPEGYRKSLRLMKQAEKFQRPIVCFVDTSGAYPGLSAEERGQGFAISQNLVEMTTLKTPILSILIGEGGSNGALALAVADEVWMMENSVYSVVTPEACASILWKDTSRVGEAANVLKITAEDMLSFGVIEKLISETDREFFDICAELKEDIYNKLNEKRQIPTEQLIENRRQRYRKFGAQ